MLKNDIQKLGIKVKGFAEYTGCFRIPNIEGPRKNQEEEAQDSLDLGRPENFWRESEWDHQHLKKPGVSANVLST